MSADKAGLGDDQGTRVGAPDQGKSATPSQHSDSPASRPEKSTGVGNEAMVHDKDADQHTDEHRSGYGGKGGKPDTSSESR